MMPFLTRSAIPLRMASISAPLRKRSAIALRIASMSAPRRSPPLCSLARELLLPPRPLSSPLWAKALFENENPIPNKRKIIIVIRFVSLFLAIIVLLI